MNPRAAALALSGLLCACGGPPNQPSALVDAAATAGLQFEYHSGATGAFRVREIIGGGAALVDIDADGDLDAYFVQGDSSRDGAPGNVLYRNLLQEHGRLQFERMPGNGADGGYGMGVAVGDVDDDGDPDLLVTNYGADVFYRNDNGRLVSPGDNWGLGNSGWSTSASFCDYDRDGDLDLFVTGYLVVPDDGEPVCRQASGRQDYCAPQAFAAAPDRLWNNRGPGATPRFIDVTLASGLGAAPQPGLGVVCADLDADGWPDFYVANDRSANQLWVNDGEGGFVDEALPRGVAFNANGLAEASMGIATFDYDADGDTDLFVTHYDPETNTLYENDGAGGFLDVTAQRGLGAVSLGYTGWGTGALDIDGDGDQELFVANGAVLAQAPAAGESAGSYEQFNQLFVSDSRHYSARLLSGGPAVSRGAAFGDVDNDGDVDVLVANNDGPASLLLNAAGSEVRRLTVTPLDGRQRPVEQVLLTLDIAGAPRQWRRTRRDGSYLSASDVRVHFAVGNAAAATLTARWPGGLAESWQIESFAAPLQVVQGTGSTAQPVAGAVRQALPRGAR